MPLTVHFLNVGRGDCTIIEFPSGRVGMVDIDNLKSLAPNSEREYLEEYQKSYEYLSARQRRDIMVTTSVSGSRTYSVGDYRQLTSLLI
jgi:hypothetical protein